MPKSSRTMRFLGHVCCGDDHHLLGSCGGVCRHYWHMPRNSQWEECLQFPRGSNQADQHYGGLFSDVEAKGSELSKQEA